jgi:hypothetical protein
VIYPLLQADDHGVTRLFSDRFAYVKATEQPVGF